MIRIVFIAALLLMLNPMLHAAEPADTSSWAAFSSFRYEGTMPVSAGSGEYLNPIIAGFYPDPSICRVGEDYYLVNSSFNYFPGLPIFHSKDLVHWTQIGNVLDRPSQFPMHGGSMQDGAYAPAIRYHNGTFYVINTLVGSAQGNFYVTATNPAGPWSEPIRLPTVGGIDPSMFFDDDGSCYICSCDGPAKPQYDGHRAITVQQFDLQKNIPIGDKWTIIDGGTDITQHPIWCEGPHIYKINGTYYAMCAQGGTSTAHSEVIFRSNSIRGTFTPWEQNPILTQMDLPADRANPVTCSGHADLVETPGGQWYAVFLACQPYKRNFFNTGRQTFLLPVTWTHDGWPVILPLHTPVPLTVPLPQLAVAATMSNPTTGNISYVDNFESGNLDFRWVQIRQPRSRWYAVSKAQKALLLEPREESLAERANPSCLLVRQQNNDYSASVTLTAQAKTTDCTAGLTAYMNESHYYAIHVAIAGGQLSEISVEQSPANSGGGRRGTTTRASAPSSAPSPKVLAQQSLPSGIKSIELKAMGAGATTRFYYKLPGGEFTQLGEDLDSTFLSTDVAGGFQGVMLGVFAQK